MSSKQYFREKYSQPVTTSSKEYFKEKYTPAPQPKVSSMKTEGPAIQSPGLPAPFVPMNYSKALKQFQAQKDIEKAHLDMLEKQKQSNANMGQVLANIQKGAGAKTQGPIPYMGQPLTDYNKVRASQENKPWYEDMFSQENYVELAKKGDVTGAAANFVGSGIQGLQSLYLNAINAADAMLHGEKPGFTYNMDKDTYDREVVRRRGGTKTITDQISDVNPVLGGIYAFANETLSDPGELLPTGMWDDVAKNIGAAKPGSAVYEQALKAGNMIPNGGLKTATGQPELLPNDFPMTKQQAHIAENILQDVKKPVPDLNNSAKVAEAARRADRQLYLNQINDVMHGRTSGRSLVTLGDTPEILQKYGANPLKMTMSESAVRKIAYPAGYMGGKHNLGFFALDHLPAQLADPVAVLKSSTQPDSLVVFTEFLDGSNSPVLAALHLDKQGRIGMTNEIASMYGKDGFENFIKKQKKLGNVLYEKKYKGLQELPSSGLQLPRVEAKADPIFRSADLTDTSSVSSIRQTAKNINPSTIPADEVSFGPNTVGAAQSTFKHEQKVSRVRSNTIENSPMFSTAEKSMLDPEGFKYDVVTEKQSLREAKQRLQVDFDGEVEFLNKARALDGTDLDTAMGVLEQYRREAQGTPPNSPEWKRFKDWSKTIQEKGTSAGQFSQAFAKYSRTPEGAVIKAEKYVSDKVRDVKKKDPAFFNAMEDVADQLAKLAEEYQYELPADPQMAANKLRQAVEEITRKHKKLKLDDDFADTVLQMMQDSQGGKTRFSAVLKEFENIPSITDNDLTKIMDYMAEAEKYPEFSKIRQGLENQAFKIVADKFPASWNEKSNAWRYMAMLTNPTTHIRNVAGNAMFGKVTQVKNQIGALIEGAVDRTNRAFGGKGIERTKTLLNPMNPSDRTLRQAAGDDFETVYALVTGGGKYNPTRVIEDNKTIFKNRALETVRKFNFNALEWEDSIALRARYKENLSRYLKANGYDAGIFKDTSLEAQNALNNARLYAIDQAKKATFRDDSALANWLNSGKHLKGVNALIEGAIPFKKTPINIVKRGAGYSPIGLTKGFYDTLWSVRKGTKTAAQAIDDIAAGLTGTAIMGIGAWMAASGLLSGAASENSKERSFEALQGAQNYALTIGDKSYTLDWAAPAALPLFVGVEIWNTFSGKNGDMTLGDILNALTAIGEPALEMTMLQGLNSTIRTAAYDQTSAVAGIATNAIANYASQFIPTASGKLSRTVDPVRRTTYIDKNSQIPAFAQRTMQKSMAKVPFASMLLPPKVDQWGREQQNTDGSIPGRLLYNMLSPGYYSQTNSTPVDQEISRLYQLGGDTSVLPGTAPKQATIDGTRYNLTADEYTQYAKTRGKSAFEMVDEMVRSGYYDHLSDSQKIDAIIKAYEMSNDLAKSEFASGRGTNYEADGGMEKAIIKAAIKAAEGKKDREGKTISGSVKEAQIKAIQELGYTRGEAEKLFKKYR